MAIPKVMGIETEYGIALQGVRDPNPVLASSVLIQSYVGGDLRRIRWDYEEETPLRDARGYETQIPADALTDEDLGLANVILTNGARYYVDHAHPEYSTPECTNPRDLVIADRAGERVLERSMELAAQALPPGQQIIVYKNNTDNKGVSYGCHENYLVDRQVPFPRLVRDIIPFFVTRQVYCGAGLLGGRSQQDPPFQLTQRADFFEVEVGLETTLKRPIVNTRDEPHADPAIYRRLHVIIGDANMSEVATYLKVGVTAIILMMIEDDCFTEPMALEHPVRALQEISHDVTLTKTVRTTDGRSMRALDIQWWMHELASKYLARVEHPAWAPEVLQRWEETLTALESDPMSLNGVLDWVTKLQMMRDYRERHDIEWSDPKMHMLDLQYHDVRQNKGIASVLMRKGKLARIATDAEIAAAVTTPPDDTRAYFRGMCLAKYAGQVNAASWDSVIFDLGGDSLQRIPMHEPLRGTKATTERLFAECATAEELVRRLKG